MIPIESILQFPNPNTPDLGCFVRRKHGFEIDPAVDFENVHVDFNPSVDFSPSFHQTYFRISCGESNFFQRCLVYKTNDVSVPPPTLETFPPDFVLGGNYNTYPTDWNRYPTQAGERFYWFFGQCLDPATIEGWTPDGSVGHSYDIYENGTLSTVQYRDAPFGDGFMDLVLEVAIVGRRSWTNIPAALGQAAVNRTIQEKGIPRLLSVLEKRSK